ncbi:MAG: hypothetical protein IJS28_05700 [Synergistaceae bacterium]|nr:hypothetical protein [Synergistaceae bacterium]
MKIDNILANMKAGLMRKSRAESFSDTEFRRVLDAKQVIHDDETGENREITAKSVRLITSGSGARRNFINLVPMKSLSLEDFSFPFSNNTRISSALRLQVMPFAAAGTMELFPVTIARSGRGASGIVWYASPDELNIPALSYDTASAKTWPAPLPFISQLQTFGGSGVTMWIDEENICSLLWQNYNPLLYRWRRLIDDSSEEKELAWYDAYCEAGELDRGGNFVVNAALADNDGEEADDTFSSIVAESVKLCPWISEVNLSRSALEGARDLERTVRLLTRVACWLLVLGGIALAAGLLRWNQLGSQVQEVRTRSENYYRQTFDPQRTGRISNPVTLARDKISELTGSSGPSHPLEEVLADIGEIFAETQSMDVTLDVIRYNSEGIDCTGTAPDMSTVLNFRKAWEERNNMAQVDNTQFVAGIGYRFDLRVRWQ